MYIILSGLFSCCFSDGELHAKIEIKKKITKTKYAVNIFRFHIKIVFEVITLYVKSTSKKKST